MKKDTKIDLERDCVTTVGRAKLVVPAFLALLVHKAFLGCDQEARVTELGSLAGEPDALVGHRIVLNHFLSQHRLSRRGSRATWEGTARFKDEVGGVGAFTGANDCVAPVKAQKVIEVLNIIGLDFIFLDVQVAYYDTYKIRNKYIGAND